MFRVVYLRHLPATANEPAVGAVYDQLVRVSVRTVVVLGVVVALGAWPSGPGRWAERVRTMWETGIAAVREGSGIRSTGAAGAWVHRYRYVLRRGVVLVAAVVLLVWTYPTGWVVFWIAVVALAGLAVVEFLDDRRQPGAPEVTPP